MNTDYILTEYSKYGINIEIDELNPLKSVNALLKKKKEIYNNIYRQCENDIVNYDYIKSTYNSLTELIDNNGGDSKKINLPEYSSSEKRSRKKIHNIAKKTIAEYCSDYIIRENLFNAVCHDKDKRGADAFIIHMADSVEEVAKYAKVFEELNNNIDKENNKKLINDFFVKKFNECKKVCEDLSTVKSKEEFVKYLNPKNIHTISTLIELQRGNLKTMLKEFGIELDQSLIKEWDDYYSEHAVATGNYKLILQSMANPLYRDIDYYHAYRIYDLFESNRNKLTDEMIDDFLYENSLENHNVLFGMYNNASLLGHPTNVLDRSGNPDYRPGIQTVKSNIILKLHLDYPELKIDNCKFINEHNEEVKLDDAILNITKGDTYRLVDSNNTQLMKLKVDYNNVSFFLTDSFKKENIKTNDIVNKYSKSLNNNIDKLKNINDRQTSNDNEFKIKEKDKANLIKTIIKDKASFNKETQIELKNNLNNLLKDVRELAPWYKSKKSNPLMYNLKSGLKELIKSDFNNINDIKNRVNAIKCLVKDSLTLNGPVGDNRIKNENTLMKIASTLNGSDKLFDNILKLNNDFNFDHKASNIKKNEKLIDSLDKDLSNDLEQVKEVSKENNKEKIIDDLDINIEIINNK